MLTLVNRFFYNPKYRIGSLYGAGVFPFWLYIKFFGVPVYRFSRKLGLNKYFSLVMANILGSLTHVSFFSNGVSDILPFFISLFSCGGVFYLLHRKRVIIGTLLFLGGFISCLTLTLQGVKYVG